MLSCNTLISSLFTLTSFLLASSFLSLQFSAQFTFRILLLSTIHPLRTLLRITLLLKNIYINVTFVWLHHHAEATRDGRVPASSGQSTAGLATAASAECEICSELKVLPLSPAPKPVCPDRPFYNRFGGSQYRKLGHPQFRDGWCWSVGVFARVLGFFQFHVCMCVLFSSHRHQYKSAGTLKKAKPDPIF